VFAVQIACGKIPGFRQIHQLDRWNVQRAEPIGDTDFLIEGDLIRRTLEYDRRTPNQWNESMSPMGDLVTNIITRPKDR